MTCYSDCRISCTLKSPFFYVLKTLKPGCGNEVVSFISVRTLNKGQFQNLLSKANSKEENYAYTVIFDGLIEEGFVVDLSVWMEFFCF